jgi:xanthine dehydrogenase accessory factor
VDNALTATSPFSHIRIAIRGGGDLGSGVAYRLFKCGFPVLITELAHPHLVRRAVSFGSAAIEASITVDGVSARRADNLDHALDIQSGGELPVLVDPEGESLTAYAPAVLIDARMLKRDPGPHPVDAPLVIGLGPGFEVPTNCHAVIETNRGHHLGRVIWEGSAEPNTGIPGQVKGQTADRVLRAPVDGTVTGLVPIGTPLSRGQKVAEVNGQAVTAPFDGVLRGLIHDGLAVKTSAKIGDVDPRSDRSYCFSVSEKSLAIGGGVLEAVLSYAPIRDSLRHIP